ncbi:MAG: phosphoenolpyruvate carboxylase [Pedosphaera sp.]|nr:phosphoenolpyruvate carboxylase [Pedosphaera sp.]
MGYFQNLSARDRGSGSTRCCCFAGKRAYNSALTRDSINQEIEHLTGHLDAIIREQAGDLVFHRLDQIRRLSATTRHHGDRVSLQAKRTLINHLSVAEAYQIAHAFSLFFQLTNLCEERARVRHLQAEGVPAMSLRHLFQELKEAGVHAENLQHCLDELEIQPVFTAHPTEAKRRAVLAQIWRVAERFDDPDEALEALWHTEEVRERRVGPFQEVENAVFYFERTIFDTAANFYAAFDAELAAQYPTVKRRRHFLTFASWVGGDRDGNPFVTPEISRTTAQWHACAARDFYERQCALLLQGITHTSPPSRLTARNEPSDAITAFELN